MTAIGSRPLAKVLIVDDVLDNIQILHEILKQEYEVFFAMNGVQAIDVAHQVLPDLILLDIMLPDVDGYEVCERLKKDKRTQEIPIIFLTAMTEVEDETRGFAAGAVDYLTKPIRAPIVRARVRTHVELKRQRDVLAELSTVDGLTGVRNRRRLDEYLLQEWGRARRTHKPISVILIDIDFFKMFNDHHGHAAGDECLKRVAVALDTAMLRSSDLVARYGGEEFACVLPDTDWQGAMVTATRLMEQVRALNIPHLRSQVADRVTISLGVAATVPWERAVLADLMLVADESLYASKREGRNRISGRELSEASVARPRPRD